MTNKQFTPINNRTSTPTVKPESDYTVIFNPSSGEQYAHHPAVCAFKGKLYATWSAGIKNEDDCGQKVMIASSNDGISWTMPVNLCTPQMLGDDKLVLTAAGLYATETTLVAYIGKYGYSKVGEDGFRLPVDANHVNTQLLALTFDGERWSNPIVTPLKCCPNFAPQKTASGRLILPGNISFPYSDDSSGVGKWIMSGIYGDYFGISEPVDDSESIHAVTKAMGWNCNLICEGSFFQTDDGVLKMLLRSNSDYMWQAESYDDGASWTAPQKTRFTNGNTKFHFGRLPDGRFYCVNNSSISNDRYPLHLHLSNDGVNFDKCYVLRDEPYSIKYRGLFKGGTFAYPHSTVWNGCLYVIYSKCKEVIEITRLDLNNLSQ